MLKVLLVLLGVTTGALGSLYWLIGVPEGNAGGGTREAGTLQERWETLRARLEEAILEGERVGKETEERLRLDLEAYRKGARPAS